MQTCCCFDYLSTLFDPFNFSHSSTLQLHTTTKMKLVLLLSAALVATAASVPRSASRINIAKRQDKYPYKYCCIETSLGQVSDTNCKHSADGRCLRLKLTSP